MRRSFEDFRVAETIHGEGDPRDTISGGRSRLLKRIKEYTPEMLADQVGFDDCSYWDELDSQRENTDEDDEDEEDEEDEEELI